MSSAADELGWQKDALCGRTEYAHMRDWFFSKNPDEKYKAKNVCFECPVREQCLKWALEHRQIWGIWGGRDEGEIRRALSVSYVGQESRRQRFPQCPFCSARPGRLFVVTGSSLGGGRWTSLRWVECSSCKFKWRSRTSANAVEAYHMKRSDKEAKEKRIAERKKTRRTRQSSKKDT